MAPTYDSNTTDAKNFEAFDKRVNDNALEHEGGIHYQARHTYFYVPNNTYKATDAGDDNVELGAVLRLGGFCDLEKDAYYGTTGTHVSPNQSVYKTFFPREYTKDEEATAGNLKPEEIYKNAGGSETTTTTTDANGVTSTANAAGTGILLSCSGHTLVRAGERIYIHSTDAMHMESDSTIDIKAGDDINISSGDGKDITITAGIEHNGNYTGSIVQKSNEVRKEVFGSDYQHIQADKTSLTEGNAVGITHGTKTYLTMGATVSGLLGASLSLSSSGGLNLNLGPVFTLGLILEFEFQLHSMSFTKYAYTFSFTTIECNKTKLASNKIELNQSIARMEDINTKIAKLGIRLQKIEEIDIEDSILDIERSYTNYSVAEISMNQSSLYAVF